MLPSAIGMAATSSMIWSMFAMIFVTGHVSFGRNLPKKDFIKLPATVLSMSVEKPCARPYSVRSSIVLAVPVRGSV